MRGAIASVVLLSGVIASGQLYSTVRLLWSKFLLLDPNYRVH
jgi:hypothetical protein